MSNPFDQFDAPAAEGGNPFDQFDAPAAKKLPSKGILSDVGGAFVEGANLLAEPLLERQISTPETNQLWSKKLRRRNRHRRRSRRH